MIQQIEALPCLIAIDTMLMEGVSAPDIAKYLHNEQEVLLNFDEESIAAALQLRRRQKQQAARQYHAEESEGEDDFYNEGEVVARAPKREPVRPSFIAKSLYNRTRKGINEIIEYEAMYLTQRDRAEAMVVLEADRGIFARDVGEEIHTATKILNYRVKAKKDLGVENVDTTTPQLDMSKYSENTVKALQSPESRHRVMDLIQRMARLSKGKSTKAEEAGSEDQIELPMPEPEE